MSQLYRFYVHTTDGVERNVIGSDHDCDHLDHIRIFHDGIVVYEVSGILDGWSRHPISDIEAKALAERAPGGRAHPQGAIDPAAISDGDKWEGDPAVYEAGVGIDAAPASLGQKVDDPEPTTSLADLLPDIPPPVNPRRGDLVRLRSGGPVMKVADVLFPTIRCQWTAADGDLCERDEPHGHLVPASAIDDAGNRVALPSAMIHAGEDVE